MAAWFLSAALLAAAALQTAGRALPPPTSSSDSQRGVYISEATALYNTESDGEVVYELLAVPPEDKSHDKENIIFIIKETVCLKSGGKAKKCPFKEDGVMKKCTASLPGSKGRRLQVRCQTMDTSGDTLQGEENKKPKSVRSHRVYELLRTNEKNLGTNFLQFDKTGSVGSQFVSSCLSCIFDFLNPKMKAKV
ncbi:cathelicidin-1-like [Rhinoderma darwinii]|uniref:cathelicidin-1-like n=1 Tax=Rhinoderma darwinii TaxID=43563 RepID=UPI003F66934E